MMDVGGDRDDFVPIFTKLPESGVIFQDVQRVIDSLKGDQIVGIPLKIKKIPKYYLQKYDFNAVYKVELPENWRLIYGIISINGKKCAFMMELFDHIAYNQRFGFKKK